MGDLQVIADLEALSSEARTASDLDRMIAGLRGWRSGVADYDSLNKAVAALLRRDQKRIDVGPVSYTVRAPCLLRQLEEAIASSSNGHGGRTSPGTRAPLNQDALDLWTEILLSVGAWAGVLGLDRRKYARVMDVDGDSPPPVGLLLRAVVAAIAGRTDREQMAVAVERNCRRWAKRIEAMLSSPDSAGRGIVGVSCRHCGERWVVSVPDPEPGRPDQVRWVPAVDEPGETRQPAVWVERGETGVIRCLWCRSCGQHTWRDDLAAEAAEHDELERSDGEAA